MQEVTYTNPRGQSVTITPKGPPFVFHKITGTGTVDTQIQSTTPAMQNGTVFQGLTRREREITVYTHVQGQTLEDMYAKRRELMSVCSPDANRNGALGTLTYENDAGKWWIPVYVKTGLRPVNRSSVFNMSMPIVFVAPDPDWRGMTENAVGLVYTDGGFEFPLTIDATTGVQFGGRSYAGRVASNGDIATPLRIEIIGPATVPGILKVATGEFIRMTDKLGGLGDDDKLYIDTDHSYLSVQISRNGGALESAFSYIDIESTPFQLDPGFTELEYFSDDDNPATKINLYYYDRFGGV